MPDLITDPENVNRQVKLRTNKITILNPSDGDKKIIFRNERLYIEDDVKLSADKAGNMVIEFNDVLTDMVVFTDPVTTVEMSASVAGIAQAIETFYVEKYEEVHGTFTG